MNANEKMNGKDGAGASVAMNALVAEVLAVKGRFEITCTRPPQELEGRYAFLRDSIADYERHEADGSLTMHDARILEQFRDELVAIPQVEQWRDTINNLVTTAGKNLILDTILAGSAFTATVVMGLKGAGTAAAADTQASHAGWTERGLANAPAYTGNRPTPSFSAASAGVKATSAAVAFAITSGGNVDGCFINVNGSATKDNTTGTLLSTGDFTGGAKTVANLDTLNVTYSLAV